jgi:LysR family transcriptional regulator, hydrogen peroxide-inducible genes activator
MIGAPHPFTLRQLQYALAVAEALSFRRAAERCRVAQPSLSAQVAQLEEALGVRLFERNRRHVLVMPGGAALLERARSLLAGADDLLEAARGSGDPLAGSLRLGIIPTVSPYLLPAAAPALRKAFPRLRVEWLEERTADLVAQLRAGALDGALVALEAELGEVEQEPVAVDPFLLATPAGHPLGLRTGPARVAELRGAEVLLLDEGHCLRAQTLAVCTRGRAREREFRATSLPTLVQMVAGGAGVTLLPLLSIATEARHGELALRPFAAPAPHRTLALVWRPGAPVGPALRRLAAALREAYPRPADAPAPVAPPVANRRRSS